MAYLDELEVAVSEVLSRLRDGERTKVALFDGFEGRKHQLVSDAIGAMRRLGILSITKDGAVAPTEVGELVLLHVEAASAEQIVDEYKNGRKLKTFDPDHVTPTISAIVRQTQEIIEGSSVPSEQARSRALALYDKAKTPARRFALRLFADAVDWSYESALFNPDLFKWPSTDAPGGDGSLSEVEFQSEGMLSRMGYRVGVRNGISTQERRRILSDIFERALPPVFPHDYMRKWGTRKSPQRLRTLAYTLAFLAKRLKWRHDDRMDVAIGEYEQDLEFLYETYYVGQFLWPTTTVDP